jgi:hypothetical protein
MSIPSFNFVPAMFLLELDSQCRLAEFCYEKLRESAPGWYENSTIVDFEQALAPQEIMIFCVGFLSCAKNIARFLFSEVKGKPRCRAAHMRDLLTVGDLPTLKNVSVRNSFEHLDERLDSILFSVVLPASFDPPLGDRETSGSRHDRAKAFRSAEPYHSVP